MEPNADLTVLLASASPNSRTALEKLLKDSPKIRVLCAETADEVLAHADVHHPQIAVLDLDWESVLDLAGSLSGKNVPTLLISDNVSEDKAFELLQHHVSGVIPRTASPEMLCKCVRAVAAGEIWISRGMVAELLQQVQTKHVEAPEALQSGKQLSATSRKAPGAQAGPNEQSPSDHRFTLTQREMQIVRAIGDGMTNNEISSHLFISKNTVKQHLVNIFDKCGVSSRVELAMFAVHHGLAGLAGVGGLENRQGDGLPPNMNGTGKQEHLGRR